MFLTTAPGFILTFKEYQDAYQKYKSHKGASNESQYLQQYYHAHNSYVLHLRASNGLIDSFHYTTLPQLLDVRSKSGLTRTWGSHLSTNIHDSLMERTSHRRNQAKKIFQYRDTLENAVCKSEEILLKELEEVHTELSNIISSAIAQHNSLLSVKTIHQFRHIVSLVFMKHRVKVTFAKRLIDYCDIPWDLLKNELVASKSADVHINQRYLVLRQQETELEGLVRYTQETLHSLVGLQQRSLDQNLYNKATELQDDVSKKRNDIRLAQMHLAAVQAQLELFSQKHFEEVGEAEMERKPTQGSIKEKWKKAFSSLKGHKQRMSTDSSSSGGDSQQNLDTANERHEHDKEREERKMSSSPDTFGSERRSHVDISNIDYAHQFLISTFKKATFCDYCKDVMRGMAKQGLRCKICKMSVHVKCQDSVPRCPGQPPNKSKLLRRQKTASSIDTRVQLSLGTGKDKDKGAQVDPVYELLKSASGMRGSSKPDSESTSNEAISSSSLKSPDVRLASPSSGRRRRPRLVKQHTIAGEYAPQTEGNYTPIDMKTSSNPNVSYPGDFGEYDPFHPSSSLYHDPNDDHGRLGSTQLHHPSLSKDFSQEEDSSLRAREQSPHSPTRGRRQKLNIRMKSFSLDNPNSKDHLRHVIGGGRPSCSYSPDSPTHGQHSRGRLQRAKGDSLDIPDDTEKSLSSASSASPLGGSPKSYQRQAAQSLYVTIRDFKGEGRRDEIEFRSGSKVVVMDMSDAEWWRGRCNGQQGYFPAGCAVRIFPGERVMKVTKSIQLSDGGIDLRLSREQIVIQLGEERDGISTIRVGDRETTCPSRNLRELWST
ncbi:PREDICTED: uncharacterized protein LOC106805455 [Priapulus caudatus]|uniref:Uncharacterized protein LOC106805455 n=1 Tax=Priapulus caudatus TaxID=37621 RepID=A0ABM1DSJ6_PRICU|nr:PREDICTED: uncharacterized protein LOC106805455 [Priapulus caudatus]